MTNIQQRAEYIGFQILKILFSVLPRPLCLAIGSALGTMIHSLDRKHRKIALANLNIAFGSQAPVEKQKEIARASFQHFGRVFAEIIKNRSMKEKRSRDLYPWRERNISRGLCRKEKGP